MYRFKEHLMWTVNNGGYYSSPTAKYLTYSNPIDHENITLEISTLKDALALAELVDRILTARVPLWRCEI
jgi:hypothetical protein